MAISVVVSGVVCFIAGVLLALGCVFECRKKRDKANGEENQTHRSINQIKKDLPNTDCKRHSNGSKASATDSVNTYNSTQDLLQS